MENAAKTRNWWELLATIRGKSLWQLWQGQKTITVKGVAVGVGVAHTVHILTAVSVPPLKIHLLLQSFVWGALGSVATLRIVCSVARLCLLSSKWPKHFYQHCVPPLLALDLPPATCSCTCCATPTQSLQGVRLIAFLPFVQLPPCPLPSLYALSHTTRALIASSTRGVRVDGRGQLPLCNIVSLQTLAIAIAVASGPFGPLQHPLPLPLRCLRCSFLPLALSLCSSLPLACVGSLISIWIVACQWVSQKIVANSFPMIGNLAGICARRIALPNFACQQQAPQENIHTYICGRELNLSCSRSCHLEFCTVNIFKKFTYFS